MQFTDEVNWGVADFAFAGALILGTGIIYELAVRTTDDTTYRAAVGVALAAAFMLAWLSLGVGLIGKDGDPANLMYFGVLAVGVISAVIARFRPVGMARALWATALAQVLVAVIAPIGRLGYPWSSPLPSTVRSWILAGPVASSTPVTVAAITSTVAYLDAAERRASQTVFASLACDANLAGTNPPSPSGACSTIVPPSR